MKYKPQKKTILKILCAIAFVFVLVGVVTYFSPNVLADAGNNNRYEVDTNTSSSSDGDSDLFYFLWWFLFEMIGPIPGIIVLIIVFIVYMRLKKTGKLNNIKQSLNSVNTSNSNSFNTSSYIAPSNALEEVRKVDPNFSSDAFISWAKEVFIRIQQAWTEQNWKIIRPFESNELFNQHNNQLQEYIKQNKINVVEKINVSNAGLREFRIDGDKEVMVLELHAVMRDYVIDAKTKNVIEGDKNRDWHMKYLMTFIRKKGVQTKVGTSNKSTTNCPNCGAPTEITSSGQCEYCDSVITTGEHDWVLNDIHSIK